MRPRANVASSSHHAPGPPVPQLATFADLLPAFCRPTTLFLCSRGRGGVQQVIGLGTAGALCLLLQEFMSDELYSPVGPIVFAGVMAYYVASSFAGLLGMVSQSHVWRSLRWHYVRTLQRTPLDPLDASAPVKKPVCQAKNPCTPRCPRVSPPHSTPSPSLCSRGNDAVVYRASPCTLFSPSTNP